MQDLGPVPPSGGTKAIFLDLPQRKMAKKSFVYSLAFWVSRFLVKTSSNQI